MGYYRKLRPQRMVITGTAGSGKTVLAIELMLGLLKDRPADAHRAGADIGRVLGRPAGPPGLPLRSG